MARINRPAPVEVRYKNLRFLITHNPSEASIENFLEILKLHEADTVVRVCKSTYDKEKLTAKGIQVMDWEFDDGSAPPKIVVKDWLNLLKVHLKESPNTCVAVHCVAGLGRAPVLVAVALMEGGMKYEDAVEFIRKKRRGAINRNQLQYLEKYRPKYCLKMNNRLACCIQ